MVTVTTHSLVLVQAMDHLSRIACANDGNDWNLSCLIGRHAGSHTDVVVSFEIPHQCMTDELDSIRKRIDSYIGMPRIPHDTIFL